MPCALPNTMAPSACEFMWTPMLLPITTLAVVGGVSSTTTQSLEARAEIKPAPLVASTVMQRRVP